MKQLMSLILLSVGLLILAACAEDDTTPQSPTATTAATEDVPTEEPEPTGMPAISETPEPGKPSETLEPTRVLLPTATPRPSPESTPSPTISPTPSSTVGPTATPEPTEVSEPTATPEATIAPTPVPVLAFVTGSASVKLTASDSAQGKKFGTDVAISGDTIIAGVPADFSKGTDAGAAVVFTKTGGVWSEQAKLVGEDTGPSDLLGQVVSLNGDTAVLGAPGDTPAGIDSGSAYVLVSSDGVWNQEAKLIASDIIQGDQFGQSAAISGGTIIIGAPGHDPTGGDSGAAYVFTRTGGVWTEQTKLTGGGQPAGSMFGWSVAIDGGTAVVGALGDSSNGANSGAAYVFTRANGVWTEQAKLTASDASENYNFGRSVAISGTTIVVGAPGNSDKGVNTGAAYVFTSSDSAWTEQAKLSASDASSTDNFGWSISISGDLVAVGAAGDAANGVDSGSVYVYKRSGTTWTEQANLTATGAAVNQKLGTSVSISGDDLVSGSPGDFDKGTDTGAAHVFTAQIQ